MELSNLNYMESSRFFSGDRLREALKEAWVLSCLSLLLLGVTTDRKVFLLAEVWLLLCLVRGLLRPMK